MTFQSIKMRVPRFFSPSNTLSSLRTIGILIGVVVVFIFLSLSVATVTTATNDYKNTKPTRAAGVLTQVITQVITTAPTQTNALPTESSSISTQPALLSQSPSCGLPTTYDASAPEATRSRYFPSMPSCALTYFEENFQATCHHALRRHAGTNIGSTGVAHTYMVHYTPLKKRREIMTGILATHNITVDFVVGFDKEALSEEMKTCFHGTWTPKLYPAKKAHRHDEMPISKLKWSQLSVVIKHHSALYEVHRNEIPYALILEDDAFLHAGFQDHIATLMREAPRDFDVLMVGGCFNMHGQRAKYKATFVSKHFYRKPEARCAHAYIVSLNGARKLLDAVPLTLPIDFQMSAAMKEGGLNSYWVEPWLSVQGPIGGCVTEDLGVGCVSVVKKLEPQFDHRRANDARLRQKWN
eukprot:PhM_4_TR87/c0_g1_i1/m.34155